MFKKRIIYKIILLLILSFTSIIAIQNKSNIKKPIHYHHKKFKYQLFDQTSLKHVSHCQFISCYIKNINNNNLFHSSSKNNHIIGSLIDNIHLSHKQLNNFTINQTQINKSSLKSMLIRESSFKLTSFKNSKILNTVFQNTTFKRVSFPDTTLKQAIFLNCDIDTETEDILRKQDVILGFKELEKKATKKSRLSHHPFFNITFKKLNLNHIQFNHTTFDFCNIDTVTLRNAALKNNTLYKTNLSRIQGYQIHIANSTIKDS